ncbi:hypothetical protein QJS10_CPA03g01295 [Acorus calamus]|uniref:Uncharacterized protein n=1 Tax=Acorus calamus TaxID=4465 RepID=A0AAV9F720_ACOCL|nr:hypothetical protein QJS10_CPA03g01295 [Acorus calamus]
MRLVGVSRLNAWVAKASTGASGGIVCMWNDQQWRVVDSMCGALSLSGYGRDIPMPDYGVPGEASRPPSTLRELLEGGMVPVIGKFTQRMEGWKGKLLSSGGRLVLLQAVLSNLPTYFLSLFKIPKGILQKIDGIRRRFLWSGPLFDRRKVHLVKGEIVCSSKRVGGL